MVHAIKLFLANFPVISGCYEFPITRLFLIYSDFLPVAFSAFFAGFGISCLTGSLFPLCKVVARREGVEPPLLAVGWLGGQLL